MPQHTTVEPRLLNEVRALLLAHRSACRQNRTFWRATLLVLGLLLSFGRHTLTQVLAAVGLGHLDWSAAYRLFTVPRLDGEVLSQGLLQQTLEHVPADQPYVVVIDGVQLSRHSARLPGSSWLVPPKPPPFRRGIHRAQRWLDLAWLAPLSPTGSSRALPLRFEPAFPVRAARPPGVAARSEGDAALAALRWLRRALDQAGRASQRILALGDGAFASQALWRALPPGVDLVVRCRRHRALATLPTARGGCGRPRRSGERAPTPGAWLRERAGWTTTTLWVRGRAVSCTYRVVGPYLVRGVPERPLFLLVVKGVDRVRGGRRVRRAPSFFLVSAVAAAAGRWGLPWPAEQLLAWAWQRWEIEVTHRELKSGFGVGETQCWQAQAAVLSVQWRVWVWSLVVLAGDRAWGLERAPVPPPGRWWPGSRRWSFGQLLQGLRQQLWGLEGFRPLLTGTARDWGEILDWSAAWVNATLAARRV